MKLGDAAQKLGVSEITLRRRVKSGKLPFDFKSGKYYVFLPNDADKNVYLDQPGQGMAFQDGPESEQGSGPVQMSASADSWARPTDRLQQAANILRPYSDGSASSPQSLKLQVQKTGNLQELSVAGPSPSQVIEILRIELQEKEKELAELREVVAEQKTLIDALEVAYQEIASGTEMLISENPSES